jgi:hypothetical protein
VVLKPEDPEHQSALTFSVLVEKTQITQNAE